MEPVVATTFPVLLPMLQQLLAAPANSGNQVSAIARKRSAQTVARCRTRVCQYLDCSCCCIMQNPRPAPCYSACTPWPYSVGVSILD